MVNYITLKQTISRLYTNFIPNADGCNIDFTPVGEANNWECVDDPVATPDEDVTYVHSTITDLQYDLYELPDHTTEDDVDNTINYVQVYARAKSHEHAQHEDGIFKIILTDNDCVDIYKSSDKELTTDYATYDNTWTENPRTSTSWTWADVDNLQVGEECTSPIVAVENAVPVTFRPNAAGDVTQLNPSPAVANYLNVDEAVKDDLTTTVRAYTDDEGTLYDLYNLPNHTTETEPITRIVVYAWVYTNDTKSGEAETVIKIGGNTYYGDNPHQAKTIWVLISTEYLLNPDTDAEWTWDNIDDLQIGVLLNEPEAPDSYNYCTQVYVEVYYNEDVSPEIRTTQVYAKVNYSTHCTLTAPEEVSDDHSQNVKMLNLWNGERIVFGLSRSKWGLVLTGREWYSGACDRIICVRNLGLDNLPITINGLNNINWDGDWRILSFGWKIITECPEHIEWILELEKYE